MSNTAREFSYAAKNWLLLLLQKYIGKTLHQSLWGETRGRRSCRSHSELWKHKIVVKEDLGVVSTKKCRSCCLYNGILNDGMHTETLKIHLPKASEVSSSLSLTASQWSYTPVSFMVCKAKIFGFSNSFNPPFLLFIVFSFLFPFKLKHAQ